MELDGLYRRRLCLRLLWPWPLTFWLPKSSQHIYERTQIHLRPKFGEIPIIGFESGHNDFGSLPAVWPGIKTAHLRIQVHVTKIRWNSLHWFLCDGYGVHEVFGTHRLRNSLTDGHTRKQNASGTEGYRWRMHKNTAISSNNINPLKCSQIVTFKSVQCHSGLTYIFNFWHSGTLALSLERQSARMSEIKNVG